MFVYKNRNIGSKEWEKKMKNHHVFIDHPSNMRTKLPQMDEDVHIQVY